MEWRDAERALQMIADNLAGPGWLYGYERHFWIDLWRVPVFEAVEEERIEMRQYGPILAFTIAKEPRTSLFNLLLGAGQPGAVEDGHLAEVLDWTESLGIDCRVPVRTDFGEPGAAEDLLNRRGYRRTAYQVMFVRGSAPPDFPEPPGIEVEELTEACEGFSDFIADGYGMEELSEHGFFVGLPGRHSWRSYIAIGNEGVIASATMMQHFQAAQLGFAGTEEAARGRGAHMALLRRRVVDALAGGARELFVVTEEPLSYPDGESAGARNLVRAGFRPVSVRTVWQPPEELLADQAGAEDEESDEGDLDDHDFGLG